MFSRRNLKLLWFLPILLWASPAWAATANVQCVHGDWSSGSSYTTSITATNGNTLAIAVHFVAGGLSNHVTGISDGTNTYTNVDLHEFSALGVNFAQNLHYVKNVTGGALTITVSLTNNDVLGARTDVCEVSGASSTSPLDQNTTNSQSAPGASADAITSGATTTTANGEYIFGSTIVTANDLTTAGTGYTAASTGGLNYMGIAEYKLQASAGSVATTFTGTLGLGDYYTAAMTFKPDAATTGTRNLTLLGVGN